MPRAGVTLVPPLHPNQVAVVTGAGSGIGRSIALALAEQGVSLCLIGRRAEKLEAVAQQAAASTARTAVYPTDLARPAEIDRLCSTLTHAVGRVDLLIHCAGVISLGLLATAPLRELDRQYRINLRAPYLLTQRLLPLLVEQRGQIVFLNSSVVQSARGGVGQYAATKQALKAVADSLRAEVNEQGVRVLSVFPGRTATPMQAALHESEGAAYQPEKLLQPEDVAQIVLQALSAPDTAEVTDIYVRPMRKH